MNTIFIVLPILTILMFDLGLVLKPADFRQIAERPGDVYKRQLVMNLVLLAYVGITKINAYE